MPTRIRSVDTHRREPLEVGWELGSGQPGGPPPETWTALAKLNTVPAALTGAGVWHLDAEPLAFDARDWWYRLRFKGLKLASDSDGGHLVLGLDGLAGHAQVWLNGTELLTSDNMFHEHEVVLDGIKIENNELLMRFGSLDAQLSVRRARPRWRTPMLENQQLRWVRTSLLGRTPGWSPPAPPIGPWRAVWLEARRPLEPREVELDASIRGDAGVLTVRCRLQAFDATSATRAELLVERNGHIYRAPLHLQVATGCASAALEIPDVERWWPHTHGEPALYQASIVLFDSAGGEQRCTLNPIGFRSVTLERAAGDFELHINGVPVFCRGACWMPLDSSSPYSAGPDVAAAVTQARDAGFNMLRLSGVTAYESDALLDACDAQGVLLWHDFMFANMDYPGEDAVFLASVRREAQQWLARIGTRPATTVLCGNSECEQQAAMWGAAREAWSQSLFDEVLAEECRMQAPQVPYWPSSAHGGAFPHQANVGTTSYYGVGAYQRPLSDARTSGLRFATECLAFANVPEELTLAAMPGGAALRVHHPRWKARTPRDLGAGWDFEDVRDHYLRELFRVDPQTLRYSDHDRYLELSRVASAEAMAAAFRDWRRKDSSCRGALIWFLRDLWRGAGWGIVDADGRAKAPWYLLRQILKPRMVLLTDEGINGLFVHLINESAHALDAQLELAGYRADGVRVMHALRDITLGARQNESRCAVEFLEGFADLSYAYRFGPPAQEVVVATLRDRSGAAIAEDFYFPLGHSAQRTLGLGLEAHASALQDGTWQLALRSQLCARHVQIRTEQFAPADQYFHLAPGIERNITLEARGSLRTLKGYVQALNSAAPVRIEIVR